MAHPHHRCGTLFGHADRLPPAPSPGDASGNRLHLRFRMKGGIDGEQWLYLASGGQSASNHTVFRKFGIAVATLDETIRKNELAPFPIGDVCSVVALAE